MKKLILAEIVAFCFYDGQQQQQEGHPNRSQNPARGILNQHMKVLDHTIQKYWDKFILTDSQECVKNQIQIIF